MGDGFQERFFVVWYYRDDLLNPEEVSGTGFASYGEAVDHAKAIVSENWNPDLEVFEIRKVTIRV